MNGAGPAHGMEASEGNRKSGGEGRVCVWGWAACLLLRVEQHCAA